MYAENKKLFIIQCFSFSSKSTIEFYKFNDDNNKFSFEKIDKIIEFSNDENMPLKKINNYCFYDSKYLILSSAKIKII